MDIKEYIKPEIEIFKVAPIGLICWSADDDDEDDYRSSHRSSRSGGSSRDDYSRGVRDGMNARGAGGYDPGRNTSRSYQEGYRHGHSEG